MSEESGTVRIIRPHNMTQDAAKATLDNLVPELMQEFGDKMSNPRYAWTGYGLEFSGRKAIFNIRGNLQVTEAELVLDLDGIPSFGEEWARTRLEQWFDKNWPV